MIRTRLTYLTKTQMDFLKRTLPMPYSLIITITLIVIIKYINEFVFGYKSDSNPKLYVPQDKLVDELVRHLTINKDIKQLINKIESEKK